MSASPSALFRLSPSTAENLCKYFLSEDTLADAHLALEGGISI